MKHLLMISFLQWSQKVQQTKSLILVVWNSSFNFYCFIILIFNFLIIKCIAFVTFATPYVNTLSTLRISSDSFHDKADNVFEKVNTFSKLSLLKVRRISKKRFSDCFSPLPLDVFEWFIINQTKIKVIDISSIFFSFSLLFFFTLA